MKSVNLTEKRSAKHLRETFTKSIIPEGERNAKHLRETFAKSIIPAEERIENICVKHPIETDQKNEYNKDAVPVLGRVWICLTDLYRRCPVSH